MKSTNYPKPTGFEVINTFQNIKYTLKEVINVKNKLDEIILNARKLISEQEDVVNQDNLIHHVILYEHNRYSDIIQPKNILDFFSHILDLYNSINNPDKSSEKIKLTDSEFKKLNRVFYKNINKFYKNTQIVPYDNCPICCEIFKSKDINIVTHCRHNFHKECIYNWFTKESSLCPICKSDSKNNL